MSKTVKPKVLFYDIETRPLLAYIWRLGEQVVRHYQLAEAGDKYGIICISYAWNDGKPAKVIHWDYNKQDSGRVVREFDKIIRQADITIGKNSDRFDVKHINTQRLLNNLPPLPEWVDYTDDLEKQLRKYFIFPSQGLDYISKELGLGGKVKMEFQDWVDIVEEKSKKAFVKMCNYNKKDVEDTRTIWNRIKAHVKPKLNHSTFYEDVRCANCGSNKLIKSGTRQRGKMTYQTFFCKEHNGYAGRVVVTKSRRGRISLRMSGNHLRSRAYRLKRRREQRIYYRQNREKIRREAKNGGGRKRYLRWAYGISLEDFDKLLLQQQSKCVICKRTMSIDKKLSLLKATIDHDHLTSKIRGILCTSCNLLLGYSLESEEVLKSAIKYLKFHNRRR